MKILKMFMNASLKSVKYQLLSLIFTKNHEFSLKIMNFRNFDPKIIQNAAPGLVFPNCKE